MIGYQTWNFDGVNILVEYITIFLEIAYWTFRVRQSSKPCHKKYGLETKRPRLVTSKLSKLKCNLFFKKWKLVDSLYRVIFSSGLNIVISETVGHRLLVQ